jgi:hypothetical protein
VRPAFRTQSQPQANWNPGKIKIIHPNGRGACPQHRFLTRPPRAPIGNDGQEIGNRALLTRLSTNVKMTDDFGHGQQ